MTTTWNNVTYAIYEKNVRGAQSTILLGVERHAVRRLERLAVFLHRRVIVTDHREGVGGDIIAASADDAVERID